MTTSVLNKPERRYDIDWLRVMAVLLLFFYHPARIFYLWGGWYIENSQKSKAISLVALFTEHWHMPILFLLAGSSTYFALQFRSGGQYLIERLKRLLVPFVFALLVFVPPQIYMDMLHNGRITSISLSYWEFYPGFFSGDYTNGFDMGHLWFIAYLFLFSLLMLPVFIFLKRESGKRVVGLIARICALPGMIFILAIPLMVANYLLLHFYPNPLYYLVFFIYGYLLMSNDQFGEAIDKHKGIALILTLGLYILWISLVTNNVIHPEWLQPIPRDFIAWTSLIAFLGYGKKFLNFTNGFLNYAGQSSYPMYILHQTVIIAIGFFVVRWNISVSAKFSIIVASSLLGTTLIYDLLVKRTNITRFLLGMRPKRKSISAPETALPQK